MKLRNFCLGIIILFFPAGCGDYNKVVKSTDYEFKYKKAVEYFEKGDYTKSGGLFKDLVNIYRGTNRADQIYYYYAKCMMGQNDYLMAKHYYRSIVKEFPGSQYYEESQFMIGYSSYLLSPKARLDQAVTKEAIESLQLYVNLFPYSERIDEANRLIDELQSKLIHKSYLNARLYYDFDNYKAAAIAITNSLKEFPDSQYREELMYMLLKSKYLLAINSIADKKQERLTSALDEYFAFIDEYPESAYKKEIDKFYNTLADLLNYEAGQETNIN
ncbi:MAG: outer membrane protein assembly factor BamD [Bacteroidales bacterium]|nr:outer membrane protein assembly factor BamD [Bacteroidales bacterium]